MIYTVTINTLPNFMIQLSQKLQKEGKVEIDFLDNEKSNPIDDYRSQNPGRSNNIRQELKNNTQMRSKFATLVTKK